MKIITKKMNIQYTFICVLVSCIILLVFFLRGNVFQDFSISLLIPPIGLFVAILITYRTLNIVMINRCLGLFFIAIFINQAINIILGHEYKLIALFSMEILINVITFYVIYSVISFNIINVQRVLKIIQYASLVLLPTIYFNVYQLEYVRRIGAKDVSLPIAVNHMGHALAIGSIIAFYFAMQAYINRKYFIFFLNIISSIAIFLAVIFSGSKAAVFSTILFGIIWILMSIKIWIRHSYALFVLLIPLILLLFISADTEKFASLTARFSLKSIEQGFQQRIDTFNNAWNSRTNNSSILFGESWRYEPINKINPIPYPHNYFLSLLLHTGVIPFVLFTIFIINRLFIYFIFMFSSSNKQLWVLFNGMIYTVMIYVLTSGRLTRVITIFVVFAIIEGYLRRQRVGKVLSTSTQLTQMKSM